MFESNCGVQVRIGSVYSGLNVLFKYRNMNSRLENLVYLLGLKVHSYLFTGKTSM